MKRALYTRVDTVDTPEQILCPELAMTTLGVMHTVHWLAWVRPRAHQGCAHGFVNLGWRPWVGESRVGKLRVREQCVDLTPQFLRIF